MAALSPATLKRARESFFAFNALNSASFTLLSGSFITLFALSLGASKALVGLLNACAYVTFFFPLGKRLVRRLPIVSVFGWAWMLRHFAMLPALAAPLLVASGASGTAFGLIFAGVAGFNLFRGIGLIGNNPVLALLSEGGAGSRRQDKGAFLVNVQIVGSLAGLGANLAVALLLGRNASPTIYAAAIGAGIAMGIAGSTFLLRAPEPTDYRPAASSSAWKSSIDAMRDKYFRSFIGAYLGLSFVAGMARSFLPVYAKEMFAQGDDAVMVYSLVGSLGSLAMGLLTRLLVDRLGAKPLYVIFTAVSALSLVPILLPAPAGGAGVAVVLVLVNFLAAFGFSGEENAGQTYFFALARPERMLDLGVLYFIVYGLGGSLGAGFGGVALDLLESIGLGAALSYRVFYGVLFAALVVLLFAMGRLQRLGSASIRESLGVMLSIRDLSVFGLLQRLDRSADPAEEIRLIHALGARAQSGRPVAPSKAELRTQRELLDYLSSPRFDVRMEAILALEKMPGLGEEAEAALEAEVERQTFTTAYVAARVLGKQGCSRALPVLRRAALGEDYMLQGSVVVALARLGDRASIGLIEELLARTDNPRVRISSAYALERLGSTASVPALVSCLRRENPPPFVSDELLLSTAAVLGLMPRFYTMYAAFLEDEASGLALLGDAAAESGLDKSAFEAALSALLAEPADGSLASRIILERSVDATSIVLSEAALDPTLGYRGFRFFIAAYAALGRKADDGR
jgi:HEAT repeat protein